MSGVYCDVINTVPCLIVKDKLACTLSADFPYIVYSSDISRIHDLHKYTDNYTGDSPLEIYDFISTNCKFDYALNLYLFNRIMGPFVYMCGRNVIFNKYGIRPEVIHEFNEFIYKNRVCPNMPYLLSSDAMVINKLDNVTSVDNMLSMLDINCMRKSYYTFTIVSEILKRPVAQCVIDKDLCLRVCVNTRGSFYLYTIPLPFMLDDFIACENSEYYKLLKDSKKLRNFISDTVASALSVCGVLVSNTVHYRYDILLNKFKDVVNPTADSYTIGTDLISIAKHCFL